MGAVAQWICVRLEQDAAATRHPYHILMFPLEDATCPCDQEDSAQSIPSRTSRMTERVKSERLEPKGDGWCAGEC